MKVQAYYQNWQIFWGQYTNSSFAPLTPDTWESIAPNLDRISYGFAILGEHAECNDAQCSQPGWVVDNPQKYEAHEMYPGDVFKWMAPGPSNPHPTDDDSVFNQLKALKAKNPNMKTLLAFGGWTFTEGITADYFTTMMSDAQFRGDFMDSAVALAQQQGFDGIELDWEYPGSPSRHGTLNDFYNMEMFATDFKQKYPKMLLAFDCGPFLSFDVPKTDQLPGYPAGTKVPMNNDTDYYNWLARIVKAGVTDMQIMAYDYFTALESGGNTMPNTPLFPVPSTPSEQQFSAGANAALTPGTIEVTGQAQSTFNNLLTTFNNTIDGKPDYATFEANNGLAKGSITDTTPQVPGTKYKVCGINYTAQAGDSWYNLCSSGQTQWANSNCGNLVNYVAAYTGKNTTDLKVGDVLQLPLPLSITYSPATCTGSPPPTPGTSNCIQKTVEGLVKAFQAAGVKPEDTLWCGLAFYGRTYKGVNFTNAGDPTASGKKYSGPAPGGFFSGNCGEASCGQLTYREISTLLKGSAPTPCTPTTSPGGSSCAQAFDWPQIPNSGIDKATATATAYDEKNGYWITYDDVTSLCMKMCWLNKQPLAGVMLFGPGDDDEDFTLTNAVFKLVQTPPISCVLPDKTSWTCDSKDASEQGRQQDFC